MTVAVSADAGLVAERGGQRLTESDAAILHGVVVVDMQIARRRHAHVDEAVARELVEHVVEEPHTGGHVRLPRSVEVDFHGDSRFGGLPLDLRRPHAFLQVRLVPYRCAGCGFQAARPSLPPSSMWENSPATPPWRRCFCPSRGRRCWRWVRNR